MSINKKLETIEKIEDKLNNLLIKLKSPEWNNEVRLTTDEAANFLGITPNALRIKVHRRQVKFEKLSNKLRFKMKNLIDLFKESED